MFAVKHWFLYFWVLQCLPKHSNAKNNVCRETLVFAFFTQNSKRRFHRITGLLIKSVKHSMFYTFECFTLF